MDHRPLDGVLQYIRRMAAVAGYQQRPDRELLELFVHDRDQAAFAALLKRHGAMVLGVCRRVLHHAEDAEDACQATFLLLIHKAASVRKADSLGSWLHGVAHRVATNLRKTRGRRQARERAVAIPTETEAADGSLADIRTVVDEELRRLPERYRLPLVLCYLEGRPRAEAARQLGWSLGTLRGRLERGRQLLRARLMCRGVTLGAGLLAPVLVENAAAALPADLAATLSKAALAAAAGQAGAGVISPQVAALTQGVLKAMLTIKLAIAGAVVVGVGLVGAGAGLVAHQAWPTTKTDSTTQVFPATGRQDLSEKIVKLMDGSPAVQNTKHDKETANEELTKLQGIWRLEYEERDGGKPDAWQPTLLKIDHDDFFMGGGLLGGSNGSVINITPVRPWPSRLRINPTKTPKEIDFLELTVDGKVISTKRAIYFMKGDTLAICLPFPGEDKRPSEFTTAPDSKTVLEFFRRQPAPVSKQQDRAADVWSQPFEGLRARLSFAQKGLENGTPRITTYLELRNDKADYQEVRLEWREMKFTVTDAAGKVVPAMNGDYEQKKAASIVLRLPLDSQLRFNIEWRGGSIPKDHAAFLDLGPSSHWAFKPENRNQPYYLQGTLQIEETLTRRFSGVITLPKVAIPIFEAKIPR